jgi:hypothetical protein
VNSVMEVLFPRRPPINYVAPAACEAILSGSSFGNLLVLLSPFGRLHGVRGLFVTGSGSGPFTLNWDNSTTAGDEPPVICYNVYKLVGGILTLVAECVTGGPVDVPDAGDYTVTPVTPEGEGPGVTVSTPTPPEGGGGGGGGGGGDPDCVGGWKLVETMTPQFSLTWFNGANPLPAGNYKLVYEGGWLFDAAGSLCGDDFYEMALLFFLRWNNGSNSTTNLFQAGWGCWTNPTDLETAARNDPFFFNHSFGKIGVNPDGSNVTSVSLYVACP